MSHAILLNSSNKNESIRSNFAGHRIPGFTRSEEANAIIMCRITCMIKTNWLKWMLVSYLAFTIVAMIARSVLPLSSWISWAIDHFLLFLFVPIPILFLSCLFLREWKALLLLAYPAFAFLILYARLFIPSGQPEQHSQTIPLRVMTFNVLYTNSDQAAVAEAIKDSRVDLVGLQELIPSNATPLHQFLSDQFPFQTPLPDDQNPGLALFSRYPILEAEHLQASLTDRSWKTVVDLGEVQIRVIVLHLTPTRAAEVPMSQWPRRISERQILRMQQVEQIVDAVRESQEPVLVLCDCNFTEFSDAYAGLDEFLDDGFAQAGWGLGHTTHPVGIDVRFQRIDYVWYSSEFIPISARVVKDGKSDHNPLVVEFDLLLEENHKDS